MSRTGFRGTNSAVSGEEREGGQRTQLGTQRSVVFVLFALRLVEWLSKLFDIEDVESPQHADRRETGGFVGMFAALPIFGTMNSFRRSILKRVLVQLCYPGSGVLNQKSGTGKNRKIT